MTLKGRIALVTGSSRGIGRAILLRLAEQGADVVVNHAKDAPGGDEARKEAAAKGVRAITVQADASTPDSIDGLFKSVIDEFGRIDIVVANAGVERVNISVADTTEDDFDLLNKINTKGSFFVLRAAARRVSDNGRIITISSNTTTVPQIGVGAYGSSKAATNYLVRVLALELAARGITVNTVVPGPVDGAGIFTDPAANTQYKRSLIETVPLRRLGRPQDVAAVTAFLAGDDAALITGQQLVADGGMH